MLRYYIKIFRDFILEQVAILTYNYVCCNQIKGCIELLLIYVLRSQTEMVRLVLQFPRYLLCGQLRYYIVSSARHFIHDPCYISIIEHNSTWLYDHFMACLLSVLLREIIRAFIDVKAELHKFRLQCLPQQKLVDNDR